MRALDDLKEILQEELQKIAKKGDITPSELEAVYKGVDIIKDIETIKAMSEGGYSEEGYSARRGGGRGSGYSREMMYDGSSNDYSEEGNSYARRRRDSRGRYASEGSSYEGGGNYRDGGSSYRGGYSRDEQKDQMIQKLEMMMNQVSGKEKEAIQRCIEQLEG